MEGIDKHTLRPMVMKLTTMDGTMVSVKWCEYSTIGEAANCPTYNQCKTSGAHISTSNNYSPYFTK